MQKALTCIALMLGLIVGATAGWSDQTAPTTDTKEIPLYGTGRILTAAESCLIELCGGSPQNLLNEINRKFAENTKDKAFKSRYEPLSKEVHLAFNQELDERKRSLINAIEMVKSDAKIDLEIPVGMYKRRQELSGILENAGKLEVLENGRTNDSKYYDLLISQGLSSAKAQDGLVIAKRVFSLLKARPKVLSEGYSYYRQTHSSKAVQNQIGKIVDDIEKRMAESTTRLGISQEIAYGDVKTWTRLKSRLKSGNYSEHDVESLDRFYQNAHIWHPLLFENISPGPARQAISAKSLVSEEDLKKFQEELEQIETYKERGIISGLGLRELQISNSCQFAMTVVEMHFPNEQQNQALFGNEKRWRDEFVNKISSLISKESSAKVKQYFSSLKLKGAKTKSEWINETKEDVLKYRDKMEKDVLNTNNLTRQMGFVMALKQDENEPVANEIEKICTGDGPYPRPWDDHAFYNDSKVHLGALSATNPKEGRSTAFHEYGHVLDGFMNAKNGLSKKSLGWITEMKNCVQKPYGEETKYIKEDFADMLSASFARDAGNFYCGFLDTSDPNAFSLINFDSEDEHSSHLYRALHRKLYAGGIPGSCKRALADKGQKFELSKCVEAVKLAP